jgi:hypothetical protein
MTMAAKRLGAFVIGVGLFAAGGDVTPNLPIAPARTSNGSTSLPAAVARLHQMPFRPETQARVREAMITFLRARLAVSQN